METTDEYGLRIWVAQLHDQDRAGPGELVVLRVLDQGSPLHPGDIISHIDGRPTAERNFGAIVVEQLRGDAGTGVRLTIRRFTATGEKTVHVEATRARLKMADG
jgi:C-terminal processing protease CtpA/Prc